MSSPQRLPRNRGSGQPPPRSSSPGPLCFGPQAISPRRPNDRGAEAPIEPTALFASFLRVRTEWETGVAERYDQSLLDLKRMSSVRSGALGRIAARAGVPPRRIWNVQDPEVRERVLDAIRLERNGEAEND